VLPRKFLRRYVPDVERVREIKALRIFGQRLFHPALWHLNRRSAAGGLGVGLFCGLIPGPLQMIGAGIAALLLRVNLPLALITTLYTNPVTIVPLYLVAYKIGRFLLGATGGVAPQPPPPWIFTEPWASLTAFAHWMLSLGAPLALGLVAMASLLGAGGYVFVRLGWNLYLRIVWGLRQQRQRATKNRPKA